MPSVQDLWIWTQTGADIYFPKGTSNLGKYSWPRQVVVIFCDSKTWSPLSYVRGIWLEPLTFHKLLLQLLKLCFAALNLIQTNPPVILVWKARESQAVATDLTEWRNPFSFNCLAGFLCALKLRIPFLSVEPSRNTHTGLGNGLIYEKTLESRWLKQTWVTYQSISLSLS